MVMLADAVVVAAASAVVVVAAADGVTVKSLHFAAVVGIAAVFGVT